MQPICTQIPSRLDRLPWTRFHLAVVLALGITWVLDGLEVTLVGSIGGILHLPQTLGLSAAQLGSVASAYVGGAVTGALFFGWLTDRVGRRAIFFVTLMVYLAGVLLSAFAWNAASFALFRMITGFGIGGEYSAINSAIDELIPARLRGRIDLVVNGSFWIGAAFGAAATILLLDPAFLPVDLGWRLGFGIGAVLGLGILILRRYVPESPRWLVTHGHVRDAEQTVAEIENRVAQDSGKSLEPAGPPITVYPRKVFGFEPILASVSGQYRRRGVLCFVLMAAQAFLYNAVFFTYGLILTRFYDLPPERTGLYLFPLAIGNFMGPLLLGSLFDTIGRRWMISGTFGIAALLLAATGWMFSHQILSIFGQTALWTAIFFFASAAASSAYLTVSEIFPLETRALAIAFFYATGTAVGGVVAPWLFGHLIDSGSRHDVFLGYLLAAALLAVAAATEAIIGVDAERQSLETIAAPLSATKAK